MLKTLTLTIGHNVGDGRTLTWSHADVLAAVSDVLAPMGYTAYETMGMWEGKPENTRQV